MQQTAATTEKIELMGLLPQELADVLASMGVPKFRAAQLFRWLQQHLRFLPGGLQNGLQILCLGTPWIGTQSDGGGNARSD